MGKEPFSPKRTVPWRHNISIFKCITNSELIRFFTLKKMFIEVNQIKFFNRTGKCGVQPPVIIVIEHIFHKVTVVDKNGVPLPR
jgi:hypothetical protein